MLECESVRWTVQLVHRSQISSLTLTQPLTQPWSVLCVRWTVQLVHWTLISSWNPRIFVDVFWWLCSLCIGLWFPLEILGYLLMGFRLVMANQSRLSTETFKTKRARKGGVSIWIYTLLKCAQRCHLFPKKNWFGVYHNTIFFCQSSIKYSEKKKSRRAAAS